MLVLLGHVMVAGCKGRNSQLPDHGGVAVVSIHVAAGEEVGAIASVRARRLSGICRQELGFRITCALGHVINRVHCAVSVYCWNITALSP